MPIDSDGQIIAKTPTDQLMACLEELSKRDDVKHVVVIFGCERPTEDGTDSSVVVYGTEDVFSTMGLIEWARQHVIGQFRD